ncbi:relaxase/mobilization nuclease-like protein [Flavobacterium araucananum]|uniref:Relaxase n=1 Tax=Flavobacterium araucananum TaxID=946678 RepID=A0A227PDG6_9FLAO|nr:relaxase/mobilization nuclease domain-containing protein [Flavobacterium araucananum]OXG07842.1 relaxase [Flavobacterium araucananum]PWJ91297.1 relaxase/mobilization nuclease-like protein [Flavobacterium araucananum]
MVTVIKTSHSVQRILNYNEIKVKEGKAECISAVTFPLELERLNFTLKLNRFVKQASLNENVKRNAVHISLNFDPSESHSKEKLNEIAKIYMEKIGFGKQPYLVYQHYDAGHPHLHLITNNIQRDGKRIDLHLLGIRKSEPARKEIEEKFGLVKAEGRNIKEQFSLQPVVTGSIQYGKAESKKAINGILNKILFDYKYSSLPELNAVLNQYNVHADRGSEESRVFKNKGLLYKILDKDCKPVGVPIKASDFYSTPTLKFLEERFKINAVKKESHKRHVRSVIRETFINETFKFPEQLAEKLKKQGIHTILRTSKDGQLYGITFVDHKTKCIFNGSSLGKQYSAKGILERCEANNLTNQNHYYQKSILTASENTQKLELEPILNINPLDILLRAENSNDYIPNQLKQKKKRRLRKRI